MKCPFCGNLDDKVLDTRQNTSGTTIRRRRECLKCNYRFTSYEHLEELPIKVVKKDGSRESFDIEKIKRGLLRAIEKRPVPQIEIEKQLHDIEDQVALITKNNHEIHSEKIGELLLDGLFELDKVAYIRFASVYRQFEDVEEFINEIGMLTGKRRKKKSLGEGS